LTHFTEERIVRQVVNNGDPGQVSVAVLDRTFMALADGSRRSIVRQLAERGELSVSEAATELDLSPAGITKHVKVLEDAGLLRRRVEGRRHLLSLQSDRLLLAQDWIDRYRTFWTQSSSRLAALAEELDAGDAP
jgi:DNA-binding transcriptional ArsR family regulator